MTHSGRPLRAGFVPLAFLAAAASLQAQDAQDPKQEFVLPEEEITAQRPEEEPAPASQISFTVPTVEQAKVVQRSVPGMVTIIEEADFRNGQVNSLADVLSNSPSVYIQSRFGGSETRLSVRGSGIRQTFNAVGISLMRNGIMLTEADGNVRPQLINPLDIAHVEVLPGANGLIYGAATLGGAINITTHTGYTADDLRVRTEFGSFRKHSTQVSTGRVLDNGSDYYISHTQMETDGFRDNGADRLQNTYANYGWRINDTWEARIHGTYIESDLQLPGSITKAQVNSDPTVANAVSAGVNSVRNFDTYRTDLQATGHFSNDSRLDLSLSYSRIEMYHPLPAFGGGPPVIGAGNLNLQDRNDVTASARYVGKTNWFGRENEVFAGLFIARGEDDSWRRDISPGFVVGGINRIRQSESTTSTLYLEDRVRLNENTRFVFGGSLQHSERERDQPIGFGAGSNDDTYTGFSPKIGLIHDLNDRTQWYGNLAASFEPPTEGNIENSTGSVDEQTALTLEIGSRGESVSGDTRWVGAVYYSMVDDELLTVENPAGSANFETGNADSTIHAGLELGASHTIAMGDDNGLRIGGTYTWNHFKFDDDDAWDDNDIPGIPEHVLRINATYDHDSGYYVGVSAEAASDWHVDFANSFEADSFVVYGAHAGYNSGGDWNAFLEARNLEDENYASNSGITTDAGGNDGNFFNPGQLFGLTFGIELSF